MKKNLKKLRLSRETLALLDSQVVASRGAVAMIQTSCTYACECPTGCSAEQMCLDTAVRA